MEIFGIRSFMNGFDGIGNKLIGLYDSARFARFLDHNNLCYLPLRWKEVPSEDRVT